MNKDKIIQYGKKVLQIANESYTPYSNFKVGALLLTNKKEYTGNNIENRSYGLTICAERVAVFKAVQEHDLDFKYIFIASPNSDIPLPPCGACRQVISEFSKDCKIIIFSNNLKYKEYNIKDLYPEDSLHDLNQ